MLEVEVGAETAVLLPEAVEEFEVPAEEEDVAVATEQLPKRRSEAAKGIKPFKFLLFFIVVLLWLFKAFR